MSKSKKVDLTAPIFNNDDAAREHLESVLWPNGPVCPRDKCGASGKRITKLVSQSKFNKNRKDST